MVCDVDGERGREDRPEPELAGPAGRLLEPGRS